MTPRRSRPAPAPRSGAPADAGVTVAELVVAMMILVVVMLGVAATTQGVERTDRESTRRVDDTAEAQYALQLLSRAVARAVVPTSLGGSARTAVLVSEPDALMLYANLDNPGNAVGPSRVEYALDDGVLTQITRRPVEGDPATYCADDEDTPECEGRVTRLVLARNLRNGADEPLFAYRDAAGDPTHEPGRVRAVEVALVVQHDPSSGRDPARFTGLLVPFSLS